MTENTPTNIHTSGIFIIIRNKIPENNNEYRTILKATFDNRTITPINKTKLFQLPTKLLDDMLLKKPGKIAPKSTNKLTNSNISTISPPINKEPIKSHKRFSDWKWIADKKKTINKINIDPNVPTSKPLPKSEMYNDEEKKEEIRKEFFKLKIKGHTNNQCRKILLAQFSYEVNIRTLRRWTNRLNKTEWDLKDKSTKPKKIYSKVNLALESKIVELRNKTGFGENKLINYFSLGHTTINKILNKHNLTNPNPNRRKRIKYIRWQREHPNS